MKIRYKKIIRSTNVAPSTLIKNINAELVDNPGYRIVNETQNCIEFKYNMWEFGLRIRAFRNVDGGAFDIISESKTIVFSHHLAPECRLPLPPLLVLSPTKPLQARV